MNPVSIVGLTGSVLTTGKVITSPITSLVTIKSKYKSAGLMASLLIGQLTTIKATLNESDQCSSFIAHGGTKACLRNISNTKQSLAIKICYLNCVNKQNSRTSFDRNQLPQKPESQKVFKKVVDNRSSLSAFRSKSGTSAETSGSHIAFDFDKEIATTNVYRNVTISPEMTSNESENTSLARSRKKTGTEMSLNQNSKQRRAKLSSKRTIEWCFEQTIPSDCDTNLPNSRPTSIDDTILTMNISDDESQFKIPQWQPVRQRSSPDIVDNPFLDPQEGPTYLPSAQSVYEESSDASTIHRNDVPCPNSYQSLEILYYILLSGRSNSGKATLTDSIESLSRDMTWD
ncbi:hypothetical protein BCON_0060g00220 [Botryotinia convoluta]|uniref:Uncharacterized protein n=1 Tax=Botryotinia convoluta TaxID=54673 RepID=A0A4Z1I8Q1_9HELO|nr:hypothetical protein BCON_0060g00220 [Botryotinia convoluta]